MTSENNENNVKMMVSGKALASIPKFVSKKFGKEGLERWLDAISVEAHRVYIFPIKTNEWYPLKELMVEPSANVAQLFYDWDAKAAAWEMGRFSADFGLKHFYKLFIKIGSSSFFLKKATEFMAGYYKTATIEMLEVTDSSCMFRITKFPEIHKIVEYRIAGWVQRALEINGCKNVNVDIPKSLADLKSYTEFRVSWE